MSVWIMVRWDNGFECYYHLGNDPRGDQDCKVEIIIKNDLE
jgi:hypothetical protein